MVKCERMDCEKEGVVDLYSGKFCARHARTEYESWIQDENQRHEHALMNLDDVFTQAMQKAGEPRYPPEKDVKP